jgi:hypothetical protein
MGRMGAENPGSAVELWGGLDLESRGWCGGLSVAGGEKSGMLFGHDRGWGLLDGDLEVWGSDGFCWIYFARPRTRRQGIFRGFSRWVSVLC